METNINPTFITTDSQFQGIGYNEIVFQVKCLGYREIVKQLKDYRDRGYTVLCALNSDTETVTRELARLKYIDATYEPETSDYDTWEQANMEMYRELDEQAEDATNVEQVPDMENADNTYVCHVMTEGTNQNIELGYVSTFVNTYNSGLGSIKEHSYYAPACTLPVVLESDVLGKTEDVLNGWQGVTCDVLDRVACAVRPTRVVSFSPEGDYTIISDPYAYEYAIAHKEEYYYLNNATGSMELDSSWLESSLTSELTCDVLGSWYSSYVILPGISPTHSELTHVSFYTRVCMLIENLLPKGFDIRSLFLHKLHQAHA